MVLRSNLKESIDPSEVYVKCEWHCGAERVGRSDFFHLGDGDVYIWPTKPCGWWRQDLSMAVMFGGEWRSHLWCIGWLTAVVGEDLVLREMTFAVTFWIDMWVSVAFWKAKEKAVAEPAIECIHVLLWGQWEWEKPIAQQSWTEKSDKFISSPDI